MCGTHDAQICQRTYCCQMREEVAYIGRRYLDDTLSANNYKR